MRVGAKKVFEYRQEKAVLEFTSAVDQEMNMLVYPYFENKEKMLMSYCRQQFVIGPREGLKHAVKLRKAVTLKFP